MADELLRELGPLLDAEGVHLGTGQVMDLGDLQRGLNSAVERHNMELFNPTGEARDHAVKLLQGVVRAITTEDWALAADLLEGAVPESPDNSVATAAGCIGVSLGLLDDWLTGRTAGVPNSLADDINPPADTSQVSEAAVDILDLATEGRASRSTTPLILRHGGGMNVLFGSALALAVATDGWAQDTNTATEDLIPTIIR